MKKPIKNISLSFPCQENWNGMSLIERGKYCTTCSSCVIDFRNKSAEELEDTLIKASAPVCGRFNKSQLSNSFLKYAASAVIATASLGATQAQEISNDSTSNVEEVDDDEFFGIIETQPTPKNGFESFYKQLSNEIKVPSDLTIKTKVYVEFVVDTLGNMTNLKIVRGDNSKLNKEALRVLKLISPTFIPGEQRGKLINVKMVLPIYFDPKKN